MAVIQSLVMFAIVLLCGVEFTSASKSSTSQARDLDALLQDYAFRAFVNPRTGVIFDVDAPSHLSGIKIAALRLRSGSLRRRGYEKYKEFEIPIGIVEKPYVERLVLVYQNLGNWSTTFYQLATYLAPILGLLAYDASDLSATDLTTLDIIRTSDDPILVKFEKVKSAPKDRVAQCIWFDLRGSPHFSKLTSGNTCSTSELGHFSIVVESTKGKKTSKKKGILGRLIYAILFSCFAFLFKKITRNAILINRLATLTFVAVAFVIGLLL